MCQLDQVLIIKFLYLFHNSQGKEFLLLHLVGLYLLDTAGVLFYFIFLFFFFLRISQYIVEFNICMWLNTSNL